jgi:outer membrane immunogenic protein
VASASHANAADVYEGGSIKDEPVYSTPYIGWSGFYVGGNIGAAFDVTDDENVFGDEAVFTGGGHLGYNWQLSDRFLVGLEGDLGFVDDDETDYLGTIRARLGLTRGPMLAYVTGGAAFIEFDDVDTDTGYVVGAGLEYKLQDNWSIGGEGLYYGFENPNDADDDDLEFWTARARLTYHFGGGGREWLK